RVPCEQSSRSAGVGGVTLVRVVRTAQKGVESLCEAPCQVILGRWCIPSAARARARGGAFSRKVGAGPLEIHNGSARREVSNRTIGSSATRLRRQRPAAAHLSERPAFGQPGAG